MAEAIQHAKAVQLLRDGLGAKYAGEEKGNGGGGRSGSYGGRSGGGGRASSGPSAPPANHDLITECRHGEKVFMSGVSAKNGREWFGFDCPQGYKTGDCARFAKAG
ncbi:hypothetical protein [Streptomyces smyrnaeus]